MAYADQLGNQGIESAQPANDMWPSSAYPAQSLKHEESEGALELH